MSEPEDLMSSIIAEVRTLDADLTSWEAGDRPAASRALASISLLILRLHRLRDRVVDQVRVWDRDNRPYDPRD
jgi:hypothetical protein